MDTMPISSQASARFSTSGQQQQQPLIPSDHHRSLQFSSGNGHQQFAHLHQQFAQNPLRQGTNQTSSSSNSVIMPPASNLTRTRSLRLPRDLPRDRSGFSDSESNCGDSTNGSRHNHQQQPLGSGHSTNSLNRSGSFRWNNSTKADAALKESAPAPAGSPSARLAAFKDALLKGRAYYASRRAGHYDPHRSPLHHANGGGSHHQQHKASSVTSSPVPSVRSFLHSSSSIRSPEDKTSTSSMTSSYHDKNSLMSPERCPPSPGSVSSMDSGSTRSGLTKNRSSPNGSLIGNGSSNLRRLADEHEKLQVEYNKMRQRYIELSAVSTSKETPGVNSLLELSCEDPNCALKDHVKGLSKLADSYKGETFRLQEEVRKMQKKFWTFEEEHQKNLRQRNNGDCGSLTSVCEREDYEKLTNRISELEGKLKELECEYKEAKENIEFLTSEQTVQAEELKEAEVTLATERAELQAERQLFEELAAKYKDLDAQLALKNDQIACLESELVSGRNATDAFEKRSDSEAASLAALFQSWAEFQVTLGRISGGSGCSGSNGVIHQLDGEERTAGDSGGDNEQDATTTSGVGLGLVSRLSTSARKSIGGSTSSGTMGSIETMAKEIRLNNGHINVLIEEIGGLKAELSKLVEENLDLKVTVKQNELQRQTNGNNNFIDDKSKNNILSTQSERITDLVEQIDDFTDKLRVSEALNVELKKQVKELSNEQYGQSMANNPFVLRQELQATKEALLCKEDMLTKLGSKFQRNRDVWLDNERKANEEIKKLDEVIDRVVSGLSAAEDVVKSCPPLRKLLEDLTDCNSQAELELIV